MGSVTMSDMAPPLVSTRRLTDGEAEGRRAHPLFDRVWYRWACKVPEGQLALAHFIGTSRSGLVVPSPELFAVPLLAPLSQ